MGLSTRTKLALTVTAFPTLIVGCLPLMGLPQGEPGEGDAEACTLPAQAAEGSTGEVFGHTCPAGCDLSATIWGTDVYTDDSPICVAAVHAGVIDASSGGGVDIELLEGRDSYEGSTRNGVTSSDWESWPRSFRFVDGGGGGDPGDPADLTSTTPTTSIPGVENCQGDSLGSGGDLGAVNTPLVQGDIRIDSLTLRYEMDSFLGEPTRLATIAWEGTGGLYDVDWFAEVLTADGGSQYVNAAGQRVYASYRLGTVPDAGDGFGTDATGSPNWSETFVTATGAGEDLAEFNVTEEEAKDIYRACFTLGNVHVLGINDEPALNP